MKNRFVTVGVWASLCLLIACQESNTTAPDPLAAEHGKSTGIPAIDALTQDIKANPDNISLRVARADAYSEAGLYKEAEEEARRIYEYDKTNWRAARLLAWAYFDNQQSKPALKVLERALELHPDTIPLLLVQSEICLNIKQYNEALTAAEKVLKMHPLNIDGHFMRGLTLKYMGDTINALNNFQTVIEQNADHREAYLQLASIFADRSEKLAIEYYDNVLRIDSTDYNALKGKADFYHQNFTEENGLLDLAKTAYERLILHHPQESDGTYNYGLLFMELNDYENAANFFNIATKYDPTFGDAYFYKGEALERKGDYGGAKIAYQNASNNGARFGRAKEALERLEKGDYLKP
ncbi:MAG: tetratricopeptide repeat protein [Aureispira sp.]